LRRGATTDKRWFKEIRSRPDRTGARLGLVRAWRKLCARCDL
jgi:hypothetical protein